MTIPSSPRRDTMAKKRMSAVKKESLVLRLLRGEDL